MRTLLVGASGQLGSAMWEHRSAQPSFIFAPPRRELDITNALQVATVMSEITPEIIINCAAWTDVDGCENDPQRAYAINSDGAWNLAQAAAAVGAWMIHVSTEYCAASPVVGVYALSKLMGERRIVEPLPKSHTILRVSWLLSTHRNGWLSHVIRNAMAGKPVRVSCQVGYPTTAESAAATIIATAKSLKNGTFGVGGYPAASRHAVASLACDAAGIYRNPADPQVVETDPTDSQYAPRPVDSRISGPQLLDNVADWRPWLKTNAPLIAERERAAAST